MTDLDGDLSLVVEGRRLEYRLLNQGGAEPWVVFLHEGLGSIALWRDFPAAVTSASGHRGMVYSRHGHGWSDVLVGDRALDFMDDEAMVLGSVLDELSISAPILVGHSDGASIALIHAGAGHEVAGLVLLAPHVFVEEEGLAAIRTAGERFDGSDLRDRMAKYHSDPVATFRAWNDVWLDPGFREWNIEASLHEIECPVLVIQGTADEYGTEAQVEAVAAGVRGFVECLLLDDCGHSPHLSQPERTVDATAGFIRRVAAAG